MKKLSYVGLILVIIIFGILVIPEIMDRWKSEEVVSSHRSDSRLERQAASQPLAYVKVDGENKKVPDFQFVDQNADTISREDYLGKVYVVEFFFSTCPTICPIMKENLVYVQNQFLDRNDFGIASISIDPRHDTPEVLHEYAKNKGITHPNWHLLTGDVEEVYELANSGFNIYAGKDPKAEGGFAHSGYFALVDREGNIRSRKDAFGNPIIYYRGSVARDKSVVPGEEEPQIDILVQDIKNLLDDEKTEN